MRYFIDTEYVFRNNATFRTIEPLSIGIVAQDGREFYRVNEVIFRRGINGFPPFVQEHVIPVMGATGENSRALDTIAADLRAFIGDDTPEFWGDYAAFDYVVLSIIMGGFDNWPNGWPMYINDLQQEAIPEVASAIPHNALADARAVRDAFDWSRQEATP